MSTLRDLGVKGWWEPRAEVGLFDGDAMAQWSGLDALERDLVQASAPYKPTYRANLLNGHAVAQFDGGDLIKSSVAAGSFLNANAHTSFALFMATSIPNSGTGTNNAFVWTEDDNGRVGMPLKNTPAVGAYNYDGAGAEVFIATPAFLIGNWHIVMTRHSLGTLYVAVDGGSESSVASGNTSSLSGVLSVGGNFATASPNRMFTGYLAHLSLFDASLGSTYIALVLQYLRSSFALGGAVTSLVDQARMAASWKLRKARRSLFRVEVPVSLRDALDNDPLDRAGLVHPDWPAPDGLGAGVKDWQRRVLQIDEITIDLDKIEASGGDAAATMRLTDFRPLAVREWDTHRAREAQLAQQAEGYGVAGLWTGTSRVFTRSSPKWVDSPANDGSVVLCDYGSRGYDVNGLLMEGQRANELTRSSGVNGTTGLSVSGSGTIATDATVLLFDPTVSPNSIKLTAGSPISANFLVQWGAATARLAANAKCVLSVDYRNAVAADKLYAVVQRAVDSKYWRESDLSWQAAVTLNPLGTATAFARYVSAPIAVGAGATTLTVSIGVPTTGTAGQVNWVGHVQLEQGLWASSRIVTTTAAGIRAADAYTIADVTTRVGWPWAVSAPGSFVRRVVVNWAHDADTSRDSYLFDATRSGSDWMRLYYSGANARWTFEVRIAGTTYTAYKASTHARGDTVTVVARWTTASAEEGLAMTASVFVNGVKGTDAALSGTPGAAVDFLAYIGSDSASGNQIEGSIFDGALVPYAMSDVEIARNCAP